MGSHRVGHDWSDLAADLGAATLAIAFLPRSKRLLISWLQSPSAVILEPWKIKSDTVSTVSTALHLCIHCCWKCGHHHSSPAEYSSPHSHVLLYQCPFFPGDLVYHSYHTKDALLPALWEEHFLKWLSPADVFLPFHRHQWGLSLDSYGLWPLPGHLQPSSLPYYHDPKAVCLADFRLLCLWFCHTPSWDCLDLHTAILWL